MKVSAIVPIFNEEKTVKTVAKILFNSPLISELIFVNDGSTDRTPQILRDFDDERIKIISLKRNRGKGFALASGIGKAQGEVVAFFDADLIDLSNQHIERLLEPILNGNSKAVLGVPLKTKSNLYRPWVIPLTGERAYFREDLLPHLEKISEKRYGIEIFLNSLYEKEETKVVQLESLISPTKWEKRTPAEAVKEYILEIKEIAEEFGKRKGLLPEDYKVLLKLAKAVDFNEFREGVKEIRDKKIKEILEKYLLKYLNLAKGKFRNLFS
jgi:glycosyltransferase involved in cell wall biosynthesis